MTAQDDKLTATELQSAAVLGCGSIEFVAKNDMAARCGEALLVPSSENTRNAAWMILAPADSAVRVNAALIENGMRVLADRDAIRVGDQPAMYFSSERLARIEPYPDEEEVYCPRDKTAIRKGDDAVCCPRCGVWHHQQESEGKGCWLYSGSCSLCDQSTNLDSAGYNWTPGGL